MSTETIQELASIILQTTIDKMEETSGKDWNAIMACMMATPDGAAAKYFREHVKIGMQAAAGYLADPQGFFAAH